MNDTSFVGFVVDFVFCYFHREADSTNDGDERQRSPLEFIKRIFFMEYFFVLFFFLFAERLCNQRNRTIFFL